MKGNYLQEILQKQVTRKEFILLAGAIILTVLGISGIIERLKGSLHYPKQAQGFGFGSYGGNRER